MTKTTNWKELYDTTARQRDDLFERWRKHDKEVHRLRAENEELKLELDQVQLEKEAPKVPGITDLRLERLRLLEEENEELEKDRDEWKSAAKWWREEWEEMINRRDDLAAENEELRADYQGARKAFLDLRAENEELRKDFERRIHDQWVRAQNGIRELKEENEELREHVSGLEAEIDEWSQGNQVFLADRFELKALKAENEDLRVVTRNLGKINEELQAQLNTLRTEHEVAIERNKKAYLLLEQMHDVFGDLDEEYGWTEPRAATTLDGIKKFLYG